MHSYLDELTFGLVSCRELVPDLQHLVDLHIDEIDVLFKATGADYVVRAEAGAARSQEGGCEGGSQENARQQARRKKAAPARRRPRHAPANGRQRRANSSSEESVPSVAPGNR